MLEEGGRGGGALGMLCVGFSNTFLDLTWLDLKALWSVVVVPVSYTHLTLPTMAVV